MKLKQQNFVQKEHFFKQQHNSRVQEVKIPIILCTQKNDKPFKTALT